MALRSSNPVSLSSRTNMAIQTLQLQIKVITVITKVCLSWPKINATELHFARSFQGYPTRPYLAHSNTRPKYRIWSYLGVYLSAPKMIKWGIPEKILQNAVQMCWSYRSIIPSSQKLWPILIFGPIAPS